ncbi:MAG TPA: sialate O-acetylesterase [Opitutus sp.]|nr:sialate O-acetylesterase [Opitutus sp.]
MKSLIRAFLLVTAGTMPLAAADKTASKDMMLFLLIGQSNMAGRGPVGPEDKVPHPRVFVQTKELTWAPAVDPLHYDKPAIAGVGLGSTFGRVIADEHPGAVVGLIPAAFGGTSLDEWKAGGKLYSDAIARAKEAMKSGRLAGILWHQGENDATDHTAGTYADRFAVMIAQLRKDLGAAEVPVVVGELGHFFAHGDEINAVLPEVARRVPHCALVSSEGLTDKGDRTHFNTPSYHELGRRYARAWDELAKGRRRD